MADEDVDAFRKAVKIHIEESTTHLTKQLSGLKSLTERFFGAELYWDAFDQEWRFAHHRSEPTPRPLSTKQRLELFKWFGNQNNKGKRWPARRRLKT